MLNSNASNVNEIPDKKWAKERWCPSLPRKINECSGSQFTLMKRSSSTTTRYCRDLISNIVAVVYDSSPERFLIYICACVCTIFGYSIIEVTSQLFLRTNIPWKSEHINFPEAAVFSLEVNKFSIEVVRNIIFTNFDSLKTLSDTVEPIHEKFKSSKVIEEYKRRAAKCNLEKQHRGLPTLFCLFAQNQGADGFTSSAIKVEEYNETSRSYEDALKITMEDCIAFTVHMHENKVYIMGSFANGVDLNSVSMCMCVDMDPEHGAEYF